ncbi:uncharacterized protein LOC122397434 [Colletes gigas]|uniref:uncharacterized protein LOC122397434 n=1 Tax=Colletes gigas TaxID=935657 RepID=UPI001C9B31B4|nr:uncharacterized protein LOC122397434 [Colletes gigas]
MAVKIVKKNNRAWRASESKMSSGMVHGLITDNVLVPITKTIFTKKSKTARSNLSDRRTELVKPLKCSDHITMPLLKPPSHLSVKRFTSTLLHSKQNHTLNDCEKISKKQGYVMNKSSTFPVFGNFKKSSLKSLDKKNTVLTFPSPMSDLSNNSFAKHNCVSTDKRPIKFRKRCRNRIGKEATRRINHSLSDVSNEGKIYESLINNDAFQLSNDLPEIDWYSTDTLQRIFDKEIQLLESNISNIPITVTVATTSTTMMTTAIKTDMYPCKQLINTYRDYKLTNTDVIAKKALSNNIINHNSEELKFPIESNASKQVQFTGFDLSASNKFLETNETATVLKNKCNEIWSTRDFQYTGKNTDCLHLSYLTENLCRKNEYPCRIKYSWQVLGRSSQTSRTLLENLTKENGLDDESIHECCIKYSWQIIGSATQTSKTDFEASKCQLSLLSPKKNVIRNDNRTNNASPITIHRNGKRFFVLNNQCTQTFSHKENQTNFIEIHAKRN